MGGEISGGANFNVVPDTFAFSVDRRLNPEEDFETEKARLFDAIHSTGVGAEIEIVQQARPAGVPDLRRPHARWPRQSRMCAANRLASSSARECWRSASTRRRACRPLPTARASLRFARAEGIRETPRSRGVRGRLRPGRDQSAALINPTERLTDRRGYDRDAPAPEPTSAPESTYP